MRHGTQHNETRDTEQRDMQHNTRHRTQHNETCIITQRDTEHGTTRHRTQPKDTRNAAQRDMQHNTTRHRTQHNETRNTAQRDTEHITTRPEHNTTKRKILSRKSARKTRSVAYLRPLVIHSTIQKQPIDAIDTHGNDTGHDAATENTDKCEIHTPRSTYVYGKGVAVNVTCKHLNASLPRSAQFIGIQAVLNTNGTSLGYINSTQGGRRLLACDNWYIGRVISDDSLRMVWYSPMSSNYTSKISSQHVTLRVIVYDNKLNHRMVLSKALTGFYSSYRATRQAAHDNFRPINVDTCGINKNCYRYPDPRCTAYTCDYLLTFRASGENVLFEISAKTEGWAAIGFSSDEYMGGDDVYACVVLNTPEWKIVVKRYVNIQNWPKEQGVNPVNNTEGTVMDGRLSCRFSRPKRVLSDDSIVDLDNRWFFLHAWGPVISGGVIQAHTLKSPPRSEIKFTVQSINFINAVGGSRPMYATSVHTVISMLAVIFILC
uniref:Ferric-chelate reductase 1-like n=1 Tax=Saccoglossus kowalevskii TaxID=10224 RepID=A0ABM0M910_SACKO|nr:PREDICTED: putative ferric-chelate reductase 1-like [Saccoglossus kowalevskii]